ncbi:MAG: ATP-binding protein [Oligoflexia bacterium]|nr:ATP-binding protein [Oligoflexia bacterium]
MTEKHARDQYRIALAGRNKLLTWNPRGVIGTPEKQVFAQIHDTLVTIGPELAIQPALANFTYEKKHNTLIFSWPTRYFHDETKVTAAHVSEVLKASASKFFASIPNSRHWLIENQTPLDENTLIIKDVSKSDLNSVLHLLSLSDFGIHKTSANTPEAPIGTGPYRVASVNPESIHLKPFALHNQASSTIAELIFTNTPNNDYITLVEQNELDEFLSFGSLSNPSHSRNILQIPSLRANLGLILFNTRSPLFKQLKLRRTFLSTLYTAIRDGAFDSSWTAPRSILPPGYRGHGSIDYLALFRDEIGIVESKINIGITNSRQSDRLNYIFKHPIFRNWCFEFHMFEGYEQLKLVHAKQPESLDCSFLAIRGDRGDPTEFYEFLDPTHPVALFESISQTATEAFNEFSKGNKSNISISVKNLERQIADETLCAPVGYYYDIRNISSRATNIVGLGHHNGPPRYLKVSSSEAIREFYRAQHMLKSFWDQTSQRRADQNLIRTIARTAHDLKSPIAVLKTISHAAHLSDDIKQLLNQTIERMNQIVNSTIAESNCISEHQTRGKEVITPTLLIQRAISEIASYSNCSVRLETTDLDTFNRPAEIPECDLLSILTNIIKNSSEALDHGNSGIIVIELVKSRPLIIEIRDNGSGFSDQALDCFFLGYVTKSAKKHGSGVGLAQSKSILEAIGGSLSIGNLQPNGAIVRVEVPLLNQD